MFSDRVGNDFDNLLFQIEIRHCFIFLKQESSTDVLNNLNIISVNTHKTRNSCFWTPRWKAPGASSTDCAPSPSAAVPRLPLPRGFLS